MEINAALQLPGVRAVLTGEDIQRWAQPFVVGIKQPMQHWALAVDCVRYVGEPVAVVVAEDRYTAEDALDLIQVAYEPRRAVMEIDAALAEGCELLHEAVGSNVVSDRRFVYGEPDGEFPGSRRISTTVRYPRNSCSPMECGVVIAEYLGVDEGYDALSNFMGPFSLHAVMALALKVPGNKLRHRVPQRLWWQLRGQAGCVSVCSADVSGSSQGWRSREVGGGSA
jgi:2-furoyl-CoA dehydrogenase large subunit